MVSQARAEDFAQPKGNYFERLAEQAEHIRSLDERCQELNERCMGLEAENEYLRKTTEFTDSVRERHWAWMDEHLRRWKLLGESG